MYYVEIIIYLFYFLIFLQYFTRLQTINIDEIVKIFLLIIGYTVLRKKNYIHPYALQLTDLF